MAFDGLPFNEAREETGAFRRGYGRLFEALAYADLAGLSETVNRHLAERNVTFGSRPFTIDPIPRLISGAEWSLLAAGLAQRARALNTFLRDAYGEQRLVEAGIVSIEALHQAEGFEPELVGRLPPRGNPAAIIGFDVVREPTGRFVVLEDNVRTPSGFEYALAARRALRAALPPGVPEPLAVEPFTYELLRRVMRPAAPGPSGEPSVAILSDGPENVAYAEHAAAAERIGAPLVRLDQLRTRAGRLWMALPGERERVVDVLYRRCDEDRIRDENGRMTPVAQAVLPAWLGGGLGLVNAFGNGVADDKGIHAHVEEFIRFYLDEEPIVRSVPTYFFEPERGGRGDLERLRCQVTKPRHGHGGSGVVIGPHATPDQLVELADRVASDPRRYISQPTVSLSRHPTVIDGRLELRHVDLRAFAFCGEDVQLMPGGLSRVALEADRLIVNSSQQGGGKDTWVLD